MSRKQEVKGVRTPCIMAWSLAVALSWACLATCVARGSPSQTRTLPAPGPKTGKALYQAACANCHGADGKGAPQSHVAFDIALPDFTDCSFATREGNADWLAVAHDGGPARRFSRMMPAFGEALTSNQIDLILDHMRGFCTEGSWPRGELNLPRPLVTEKAYPEDEAVYTIAADAEGSGAVSSKFVYERRFGARNQLELILPFGWRELSPPGGESGAWAGGIGDIAFGAKRALFHSLKHGSIFSVAGEIVLPTGDRAKGLGKGTTVFEPFASFGQVLPSEFFLHAQGGVELPVDSDRAEKEAFWRFALGRSFTQQHFGRTWSPMIEILAARELVAGEKLQWDAVPQAQITLSRRQHIMMSVGVRLPLTESGIRKTQVLVYLLWDWFDGGFFEGW